jgi:hypothetical protein
MSSLPIDNYNFLKQSQIYSYVNNNFNVIKSFEGHTVSQGKYSGQVFNSYWLVKENNSNSNNNSNNNEFYISEARLAENKHILFKFSKADIINFKNIDDYYNPTWYLCKNGYIASSNDKDKKGRYFHQHIMNHYGQGTTAVSVDHINQNKLDNRRENLRVVTQYTQNLNQSKKSRPDSNAKNNLPENFPITREQIPSNIAFEPARGNRDCRFDVCFTIKKQDSTTGKMVSKRLRKQTTGHSSFSISYKLICAIKLRVLLYHDEFAQLQERAIDGKHYNSSDELWQNDLKFVLQIAEKANIPITKELKDVNNFNFPQVNDEVKAVIEAKEKAEKEQLKKEKALAKAEKEKELSKNKVACPDCGNKVHPKTLKRHQKHYCKKREGYDEAEYLRKKQEANKKKSESMKAKRKCKLSEIQLIELADCIKNGKMTLSDMGKKFGVRHQYISYLKSKGFV